MNKLLKDEKYNLCKLFTKKEFYGIIKILQLLIIDLNRYKMKGVFLMDTIYNYGGCLQDNADYEILPTITFYDDLLEKFITNC